MRQELRGHVRRAAAAASVAVMINAGLVGEAHAQIGTGWVEWDPSSFLDFQCGGTHIHKPVANVTVNGAASYTISNGLETFKLLNNGCNRVERRHDEHYTSGSRQMQGDVLISNISSQSVHQIFHGSSGPYLMVKGYTSNGGELRKLAGSVVLASGINGAFVRYNYMHRVGSWTEIYINGSRKFSGGGAAVDGSGNNNKYGLYGTKVTDNPMVQWRNVRHFRDGSTPCSTCPTPTPRPTATPIASTPTPSPTPTPSGGLIEITPPASAATASTHDGNLPGNTVDNNLTTRWSANGDGQWIRYDLAFAKEITDIGVAVYNGTARRNQFELQVSNDNLNWETVWSGQSSGTTTAQEMYDVADRNARWVRYLGHMADTSTFNSLSEVSLFQRGGSPTPTPIPTFTPAPTGAPTPTPTATPAAGPVELTPGGTAVSASTHDGNLPANTVDDNLATRWSANGDGAWIQYDLGATRTVTSVRLAWYQGNARASTFDVLASDSATGPWTTLAAGRQSSGTTTALETHDVTDGAGRHVRIVGHGNTLNTWNSVAEVQIWGTP
jgi:hypothetical protein